MNNLGILKEILGKYGDDIALNNKLIIALLVFILINLLTTLINIISQHNLKSKDKKIISFQIKETKRIHIFEKGYHKLDNLSFFDGKNESVALLEKIQESERFISKNKMYIGKKELKAMYEITDYYKTVASDFRRKDYSKEIQLFETFSKLFNK